MCCLEDSPDPFSRPMDLGSSSSNNPQVSSTSPEWLRLPGASEGLAKGSPANAGRGSPRNRQLKGLTKVEEGAAQSDPRCMSRESQHKATLYIHASLPWSVCVRGDAVLRKASRERERESERDCWMLLACFGPPRVVIGLGGTKPGGSARACCVKEEPPVCFSVLLGAPRLPDRSNNLLPWGSGWRESVIKESMAVISRAGRRCCLQ